MTVLRSVEQHVERDLSLCSLTELAMIAADGRSGLSMIEALLTRVAAEAQRREDAGDGVVASDLVRGDGELSRARADAIGARAALAGLLPAAGRAVASGAARPENADALAAAVERLNPTERVRLAAHDADLARRAATDTPETFARHLARRTRDARDRPDPMTDRSRAERERARSYLNLTRKPNGRWYFSGDLTDEWGSPINDCLRAHARTLAGDRPCTSNHMAQALYDLVVGIPGTPGSSILGHRHMGIGYIVDAHTLFADQEAAPAGGPNPGPGPGPTGRPGRPAGVQDSGEPATTTGSGPKRSRPVAETWGGHPVDPDAIRRLACDTDLYAILIGAGGEPRGAHRTHRSATRHQRLQLRALYPTCPLDGTTPFEQCEIHHVNVPHAHGGATVLANLLPLSSRWHHRVHDLGWRLTMRADRALEVRTPDGRLYGIFAPPTPITRQRE